MGSDASTVQLSARELDPHAEWDRHMDLVIDSLQCRFGPSVAPDVIRAEVEAAFASYSAARVRDFVPLLVEARVRDRLQHRPAPD